MRLLHAYQITGYKHLNKREAKYYLESFSQIPIECLGLKVSKNYAKRWG